jgi:putative flippase GtrA
MKSLPLYVFIQLLAYFLDVGTFIFFVQYFDASPFLTNIFAKFVAGSFAFFTHRHLTFAASDGGLSSQAILYLLLLFANSLASSAFLLIFVIFINSSVLAKIIADFILVFVSFGLSKTIVFRRIKSSNDERRA